MKYSNILFPMNTLDTYLKGEYKINNDRSIKYPN